MSAGLDYVSIIREGESRCKEKTRENGLFLGFFLRTSRARPVKRPFWRCSRRPWPLPPPCGAVPAGCRGPVLCAIRRPDSGICRGAPAARGRCRRLAGLFLQAVEAQYFAQFAVQIPAYVGVLPQELAGGVAALADALRMMGETGGARFFFLR